MSGLMIGLLGIVAFFILLIFRMPIGFAMAITGFVGFAYLNSPASALKVLSSEIFSNFTNYTLSEIPLFILMGFAAYHAGLGSKLYSFAYKLIGHFPGGLAIATQPTCAIFGAVCGSNTATAATIGSISIPEMKKYNYDISLATGSVAAGGSLGTLIPPSVNFIIYGIATQTSIGALFLAGIMPGILLTLLNMIAVYYLTQKNPALGPPGPKASWKERFDAAKDGGLWEVFLIFILSLGGLFLGWFTPTESGAVGAFGVIVLTLLRKLLNWEGLKKALSDTTKTTAMIMLLLAGAIIFGRFMAISRLPFELGSLVAKVSLPPFLVMVLILFIYFILGLFMDALAMVLLTIPIFYPIAVNTLGYDPIWFGAIIVLALSMGCITPPVGINVYVIKGVVPDVPLEAIFRGIWPFFWALTVCLLLLVAFPQIVTFLPNLIMKI